MSVPSVPSTWVRALVLVVASSVLGGAFEWVGLPAGLLLGPMIVGIVLAVRGWGVAVPDLAFRGAQAVVGCLIAGSITAGIVHTVAGHLALFLGTTAATLAVSAVIGWLGARFQILPGTAAIWGSMPGAATAMVLMARSFGADARLVAAMTYSRVVCVAGVASVLAALLAGHHGGGHVAGGGWFAAIDPLHFAETLAVAAIGATIGVWLRLPAGAMIGPLAIGAILNVAGLMTIALPGWLLAIAYAVIGWRIGMAFTREIVAAVARALPGMLASIGVLMACSGGMALILAHAAGIDPMTAYLATSPGGMDSVAIIASSTRVDVPFVMAMQLLRFVAVLVAGPALARLLARGRSA